MNEEQIGNTDLYLLMLVSSLYALLSEIIHKFINKSYKFPNKDSLG